MPLEGWGWKLKLGYDVEYTEKQRGVRYGSKPSNNQQKNWVGEDGCGTVKWVDADIFVCINIWWCYGKLTAKDFFQTKSEKFKTIF